jgi:hypothetical protein
VVGAPVHRNECGEIGTWKFGQPTLGLAICKASAPDSGQVLLACGWRRVLDGAAHFNQT